MNSGPPIGRKAHPTVKTCLAGRPTAQDGKSLSLELSPNPHFPFAHFMLKCSRMVKSAGYAPLLIPAQRDGRVPLEEQRRRRLTLGVGRIHGDRPPEEGALIGTLKVFPLRPKNIRPAGNPGHGSDNTCF